MSSQGVTAECPGIQSQLFKAKQSVDHNVICQGQVRYTRISAILCSNIAARYSARISSQTNILPEYRADILPENLADILPEYLVDGHITGGDGPGETIVLWA